MLGAIRKHLGDVFHDLAKQKGVVITEIHVMLGHVHMYLSIPQKLSVSNVVEFIKRKSALSIARKFKCRQKNLMAKIFWLEVIVCRRLIWMNE